MKKKVVFIDMDGTIADFDKGVGHICVDNEDPPEMFQQGFFLNLEVMEGAIEAVHKLFNSPFLDVYIASKPTTGNLHCATEKYLWIHFWTKCQGVVKLPINHN